jgi:hypothetical protein
MPERLDEGLLDDVLGLTPGAEQRGRTVRHGAVARDQHLVGGEVSGQ